MDIALVKKVHVFRIPVSPPCNLREPTKTDMFYSLTLIK